MNTVTQTAISTHDAAINAMTARARLFEAHGAG